MKSTAFIVCLEPLIDVSGSQSFFFLLRLTKLSLREAAVANVASRDDRINESVDPLGIAWIFVSRNLTYVSKIDTDASTIDTDENRSVI